MLLSPVRSSKEYNHISYCGEKLYFHSYLKSMQPCNNIQQQKEGIRKELETILLNIPTN